VFHFSGHGSQVADQKPFDEDDDLDEALCVSDVQSDGSNLLLDDELGRRLDDSPASLVTVILDCCHAGTGHKTLDDDLQPRYLPIAPPDRIASVRQNPWRDVQGAGKGIRRRVAAFFACQANQQAYERKLRQGDRSLPAGQFTHYLVRGLESGNADLDRDGTTTQAEVEQYVQEEIQKSFNVRRKAAADQQRPSLVSTRPTDAMFFAGPP
jgi:hypothetical protein